MSEDSREGCNYLPEGVTPGTPRDYVPPEPGTGTVYVGPPDEDDLWNVSWQGDDNRFTSAWGSREAVVAWALAQPARTRLICWHKGGDQLVWAELLG